MTKSTKVANMPLAVPEKKMTEVKAILKDAEKENTTLDTVYAVDGSKKDVTLEINVGDKGETGLMTVLLDKDTLEHNLPGDFTKRSIGSNIDLNNKKLKIVANVADTSQQTNLTSLTIRLKGGLEDAVFPLMKIVDEEGNAVDYLCLIRFFNPFK
jgi:hypothetical protein